MSPTMPAYLADTLSDRLAVIRRRPHELDHFDLLLTTDASAAALYREAQHRLLAVQVGAEVLLRRAVAQDPDFALGHATLALVVHDAGRDGRPHARAALRSAMHASARERSFVGAVAARVGRTANRKARWLRHLAEHPRDAVALNAAVPTIASSGAVEVTEQAWTLVESRQRDFGAHWWFTGLLGWVRQEQDRLGEAGELASWSLSAQPGAGHAAHAMAHVYYESGRHIEGLRWLDDWVARNRRTTVNAAHYSWHAALHELALGAHDDVRRRWYREIAPPHTTGLRALVDGVSLLWRAHLADAWEGPLPVELALDAVDPDMLTAPETPFAAMHAALALAAREDAVGLRLLGRTAVLDRRPVFRDLVAPFAAALGALVAGRADQSAELLLDLMPRVAGFGGSKAQRDVVEQTLLYALVRSGRSLPAQQLVQLRLDRAERPRG